MAFAINTVRNGYKTEHGTRDHFQQGLVYYRKGQLASSLNELNLCIAQEPEASANYHARGNIYLELKEYKKAIDDYSRAIRLRNDDATAYNNRAWAYLKLGKRQKAFSDFHACKQILHRVDLAE